MLKNVEKNIISLLKNFGVELGNFYNFAFDTAFIYLMVYSISAWQENFLNTYLNTIKEKGEFKELFRVDLISLANRFAAQCYYLSLKKKAKGNVFSIFKNYLKFLRDAIYQKT